jgi:prevent-host-death family protein
MNYSIYEAKARLSEIIRQVKARRRVVITERGVPVAKVIPYTESKPAKLADRIAALVKSGSIVASGKAFHFSALADCAGAVERFLQQDRE